MPTDVQPAIFEELEEGNADVSALVSTDPAVDVGGREDLRGFGGSATVEVVRGARATVRVVIDAAGVVTGLFLNADRTTPIRNAQVRMTSSRGQSYDVTGTDGRFRFVGVPVGSFSLSGLDPMTLRRGEASGQIEVDGQTATVDLVVGPIGRMHGFVVDASNLPVSTASVTLKATGQPERFSTTNADGSFSFESVPGGSFTVSASTLDGLGGVARGAISTEGEDAEVRVTLSGSGRVEGMVIDAGGNPVPAAEVTLIYPASPRPRRLATQSATSGSRDRRSFRSRQSPSGRSRSKPGRSERSRPARGAGRRAPLARTDRSRQRTCSSRGRSASASSSTARRARCRSLFTYPAWARSVAWPVRPA